MEGLERRIKNYFSKFCHQSSKTQLGWRELSFMNYSKHVSLSLNLSRCSPQTQIGHTWQIRHRQIRFLSSLIRCMAMKKDSVDLKNKTRGIKSNRIRKRK